MTAKNPIDRRPFKSKADQQMQMALERQYRGVAIASVIAVLESRKSAAPASQRQARG